MNDELNSSILGSYEFWNNLYDDEIENFMDHGDVGEIWFGKETMRRIIKWINENSIEKNDSIIDLGCGNGVLLIELFKAGFTNLHGVDYSINAINLATAIAKRENCSINYFVGNLVQDPSESQYCVCIDKGTYDAISLDPENSKTKRQSYIANVTKLLKEKGIFIITSCNWTDNELKNQFNGFQLIEVLPAPSFTFGGKTGKMVTTIIFKKI